MDETSPGPARGRRALPALLALLALTACGAPRPDWREEVGQPTPNPVLVEPALPLALPPTLDLPPPGGTSRARADAPAGA